MSNSANSSLRLQITKLFSNIDNREGGFEDLLYPSVENFLAEPLVQEAGLEDAALKRIVGELRRHYVFRTPIEDDIQKDLELIRNTFEEWRKVNPLHQMPIIGAFDNVKFNYLPKIRRLVKNKFLQIGMIDFYDSVSTKYYEAYASKYFPVFGKASLTFRLVLQKRGKLEFFFTQRENKSEVGLVSLNFTNLTALVLYNYVGFNPNFNCTRIQHDDPDIDGLSNFLNFIESFCVFLEN